MKPVKSTRHSKITGDLGERLTLYWLSKHGFECALVDHTGIDIIANHPSKPQRLGISVKSRSRSAGKEESSVLIERKQFAKAREACDAFACVPYFAIFTDVGDMFRLFLIPMKRLEDQLGRNKTVNWKMTPKALATYAADKEMGRWELRSMTSFWGALDR